MGQIITLTGRGDLPVAPPEIAEEVELYARESGRHATLKPIPTKFGPQSQVLEVTWRVDMTLHPEDKRNVTYQEGRMESPPVEEVWLHEENPETTGWHDRYKPKNIHQMGPSGVRQFLERGNVHSGRGEFASLEEVVRKTAELNEAKKEKRYKDAEDRVRQRAREKRRSRLKIPFLRVGVDLKKPNTKEC